MGVKPWGWRAQAWFRGARKSARLRGRQTGWHRKLADADGKARAESDVIRAITGINWKAPTRQHARQHSEENASSR